MILNIPFEKNIKFDTDVKEITSISIEHEITKNERDLLGNFIFEGTYKENELSINETPFNFIVPFSVDFNERVNTDSLEFTIDNFTYDLKDNELIVKVDYIIQADIIPEEEENLINEEKEDERVTVINNKESLLEDDFITYHVHEISDTEDINIIANKYNVDSNTILILNKDIEIKKGGRLIIPIDNE